MSYHSQKVIDTWERIKKYEETTIYCSECSSKNTIYDNYCVECGHKLKNISKNDKLYKKFCECCGSKMNKHDIYCDECGHKLSNEKIKICSVCGEWIGNDRYCSNCGHDTINRWTLVCANTKDNISSSKRIDIHRPKICPNCNTEHQIYFNYCECCGTKLVKK